MSVLVTKDRHPAIMVKEAVLARSGVYKYTYDEMVQRGFTPTVKKDLYTEYRPKDVLIRNKDKFGFAVVSKEHTDEETTPANFHEPGQVSGVVGDSVRVRDTADGEVELIGKVAFYTQDAVDYYNDGNRDTSADYVSVVEHSKDSAYDFMMKDIQSVNGVAVTAMGRGGRSVRVLDSFSGAGPGGIKMLKGVLGAFGLVKTQDSEVKLSKILMEGVRKMGTLDANGVKAEVARVMDHVSSLGESETRTILAGAVQDSFLHPVEVLAKEKDVSSLVDKLYGKCRTADAEAMKKIVETEDSEETDEEKKEREKKEAETKTKDSQKTDEEKKAKEATARAQDTAKAIKDAVDAAMSRVTDSIPSIVEKALKNKLGLGEGNGPDSSDKRTLDSNLNVDEEAEFLLRTSF